MGIRRSASPSIRPSWITKKGRLRNIRGRFLFGERKPNAETTRPGRSGRRARREGGREERAPAAAGAPTQTRTKSGDRKPPPHEDQSSLRRKLVCVADQNQAIRNLVCAANRIRPPPS